MPRTLSRYSPATTRAAGLDALIVRSRSEIPRRRGGFDGLAEGSADGGGSASR